MIKKVTFIQEDDKKELIKRFKKKELQAMNIVNQYMKGRNISVLKTGLQTMLRNISAPTNVSAESSNRISPERSKKDDSNILKRDSKGKIDLNHKVSGNNHGSQLNLRSSVSYPNIEDNVVGFAEFEKVINDLVDQSEISKHQAKYVIQRFVKNDEFILSTWEIYMFNKNTEELIENIRISSAKVKTTTFTRERGKTPAQLKQRKKEIINILVNKEIQEKQEIKQKQKHVIEILLNENLLNKDIMPLINEMIENENNLLISALEIFSVTKDHWDFCETLDLIYAIFRNNKDDGSEKKNSMDSETLKNQVSNLNHGNSGQINEGELKMIQILNSFLNNKTKFSESEKRILQEKLKNKDQFLLSSVEFYMENGDDGELLENLEMLKKK